MNDLQIWRENNLYVARINSLHVNTQAKTLKELKNNLKEAIEVSVEGLIELKKSAIPLKVSA